MYDTDEEIQRKRRNLFIIIGVVVLLIIILIIFLIARGSGKKKSGGDSTNEITCTLEVQDGVLPDSNGIYHQSVVVGFKSITAVSKNYEIIKKTIGTVDNLRNKETFTASKSGQYHLFGFVQDSVGNKGKCEINLELSLTVPTCELEVTQGTLGDNGWYRSDVEVGFKSMDANNPTVSIAKYYIEKELKDLDTSEVVKADPPTGNVEKYTVKDNMETNLIGYVIDSSGNEGVCRLKVNKDSSVPTCKLKVNSGTKNANGEYTDNPEIGFEEAKDDVSQIAAQGIGLQKNYSQTTFKVTDDGKTTVVGYVKDKAGNEGTCSIEITRPGAAPAPTPESNPSCKISKSGSTYVMNYSTSNGASITSYGFGDVEVYNNRSEISESNLSNGSHLLHGIVKDSNGNVARCTYGPFTVSNGELLANKVKVGDYVGYDAGTWNETRSSEVKQDGYYWGMTAGTSKQTGIKCNRNDTGTRNGWMVLAVSNGKVLLIHAGTPECIYHAREIAPTTTAYNIASRSSAYVNSDYADGYTVLSCSTPGFNCNVSDYKNNSLFVTGNHYWVAQAGAENGLMTISAIGSKQAYAAISQGFRPIVQLKADVLTTGKSGDMWVLK